MILLRAVFLIFSFLVCVACKSSDGQLKCLDEQTKIIADTDVYKTVQKSFRDSLENWISSGVKGVQFLKKEDWKIDEVLFFNTTKDKVLLLILCRDLALDAKRDDTRMVLGVKNNEDKWDFYFKSMPAMGANREDFNKKEPFTFEELSEMVKREIINGGYFIKGTCIINNEYVDGWYVDWRIEKHKEFLKERLED